MSSTDSTDGVDEFEPRERGLLMGAKFAESCGHGEFTAHDQDGREIDLVTEAAREAPHLPEQLRVWLMDEIGMRERLDASVDDDAESAFWAGFRDGVRAYLAELVTGTGAN